MNRITLISSLALTALVLALCASVGTAGESRREAFSEDRFRALQAEGALVLVDVAASWCPTCAKQAKLVDLYRALHPEAELHVLVVDFDAQKEWVRYFKAPRQSTLILFRGEEQLWFSVAETREGPLFGALDEAAKAG